MPVAIFLGSEDKEATKMQAQTQDWQALSEAASRERDPDRLIELVQELNRAIWLREIERRHLANS